MVKMLLPLNNISSNCSYYKVRLFLVACFCSVTIDLFGMQLSLLDGLYKGEKIHFAVLKNYAEVPERVKIIKRDKTIAIDALTELNLIKEQNTQYLMLFKNQSNLLGAKTKKDLFNKIFWRKKSLLYFPLGLFVCAPLVGCVSDEYKKMFIYLGIGASFIACMEAFKFFRKDLKLTETIQQYTDTEKKYSEKRVNYLIKKRPE